MYRENHNIELDAELQEMYNDTCIPEPTSLTDDEEDEQVELADKNCIKDIIPKIKHYNEPILDGGEEKLVEVEEDEEDSDSEIEEEQTSGEELHFDQVKLFIKPARKNTSDFVQNFPYRIFCSPYKYDIKIIIPTNVYLKYKLAFRFLDGETGKSIKRNHKGKCAIEIGKIKTEEEGKMTIVNARVCFTVCSFHHYRRPFIFMTSLKSRKLDENNSPIEEKTVFISNLFQTFARKVDKTDTWNLDVKIKFKKKSKKVKSDNKRKRTEESVNVKKSKFNGINEYVTNYKEKINEYSTNSFSNAFSKLDNLLSIS